MYSYVIRFARCNQWKTPAFLQQSESPYGPAPPSGNKQRPAPTATAAVAYEGPIAQRTRQKSIAPSFGENNREYILISLFDGINTAYHTLTSMFGPPLAAILAEENERVRQITASMHQIDSNNDKWQTNKHGIPIHYAPDAWDTVKQNAQLLKQLLTFAKQDTEIVLIAGSPCQDLTVYGPQKGILGFTGSRSRHMHAFYYTLKVLEHLWPTSQIFYVLENAGSMQEMHLDYITAILNLQPSQIKRINTSTWSEAHRNRLFFHQQQVKGSPKNNQHLGITDGPNSYSTKQIRNSQHTCYPGADAHWDFSFDQPPPTTPTTCSMKPNFSKK